MTKPSTNQFTKTASAAAFLTAASDSQAAKKNKRLDRFLTDIKSDDPETRYSAAMKAGSAGVRIIPKLGKLLVSDNPGIAKSAGEALRVHVHSAAQNWNGRKRKGVMRSLVRLTRKNQAKKTRVEALRHLSTIGDANAVPPAAELLADEELREEAVYCLERIPGEESAKALLEALEDAPKDFKPRIIAALGHRKDALAADKMAEEMGAYDTAIAIPAMKAVACIGKKPEGDVSLPDFQSLSDREKAAYADSWFRYLDAQIEQGNTYEAEEMLAGLLGYVEEEHLQCAAIVSLTKTGSSSAVAVILPQLKSISSNVRHAAKEALIAMKGSSVNQKLKDAMQKAEGETKKTLESILKARQ